MFRNVGLTTHHTSFPLALFSPSLPCPPPSHHTPGDFPAGFADRSYPIPRGRGLGGSNELNYMLHVRGTPEDYNAWQEATGDARWGASSMLGAEQEYEKKIHFASKAAPLGGGASHAHALASDWVAAGGESKYGNQTGSYNDPSQKRDGAFHYEHATRKGVRQSTARQFLLPRFAELSNLDVVVGATVETVMLAPVDDCPLVNVDDCDVGEGDSKTRATGVALSLSPCHVPSLSAPVVGTLIPDMPCLLPEWFGGRTAENVGRTIHVHVKKEIILSAGAYESPHVLLKSGIGPAAELKAAGVAPKVDLPAVGKHLQDHPIIGLKYRLGPKGGAWLPKSATKLWLALPSVPGAWLTKGHGILSSSGCDLGYFGASSDT